MRHRSITGPLILLLVGGLLLWNNFHPEASVLQLLANYWPFLLILWGALRLIEVLLPANREWRGSFTGGEVALIVLICIIGWGIHEGFRHGIRWRASGIDMFGDAYDYPVNGKAAAQGAKRIVFDSPAGNIKITGADIDEVQVNGHKSIRAYGRGDADRTNGNTPLEIQREGDHILIRTNQDHAPDNQRISDDLQITVPRAMAVDAHIRRGDFDISDITGNLELATRRGDARLARLGGNARLELDRSDLIRAVDVKGGVEIEGQGADLSLENVQGKVSVNGGYTGSLEFKNLAQPLQFQGARNTELHVEAVPGQITMDMGQFRGDGIVGPVRLVTRSRDIRMSAFTQSLALETERGDVELLPSLPMPSIEARSGNGDINLIVPDKAAFQLDATAEHGDAVNGYGSPLEQHSSGHSSTLKGKTGDGPMVRLTSTRGTVGVRKGPAASRFRQRPRSRPSRPLRPRTWETPRLNCEWMGKDSARTAPINSGPLVVLFLVNVLNFYDRQVLGAIFEPLRHEFHLSDTQFGGLTTVFTVVYALAGFPLGRLADRGNGAPLRKRLLASGVAIWAGLTACGAFGRLQQLCHAAGDAVGGGDRRSGVRAGGHQLDRRPLPARAAHARHVAVHDGGSRRRFPRELRRGRAGGPGVRLARAALLLAAIPAAVLIPALLSLGEPAQAARAQTKLSALSLVRIPAFRWIAASGAIVNFVLYTFSFFLPAFLTRVHGLSVARAGLATGIGSGVAGVLGALAAGRWGDRLTGNLGRGRLRAARRWPPWRRRR